MPPMPCPVLIHCVAMKGGIGGPGSSEHSRDRLRLVRPAQIYTQSTEYVKHFPRVVCLTFPPN
eukprot:722695-Rhodomonas_salina.1